jgi:hypothetical protein
LFLRRSDTLADTPDLRGSRGAIFSDTISSLPLVEDPERLDLSSSTGLVEGTGEGEGGGDPHSR